MYARHVKVRPKRIPWWGWIVMALAIGLAAWIGWACGAAALR